MSGFLASTSTTASSTGWLSFRMTALLYSKWICWVIFTSQSVTTTNAGFAGQPSGSCVAEPISFGH